MVKLPRTGLEGLAASQRSEKMWMEHLYLNRWRVSCRDGCPAPSILSAFTHCQCQMMTACAETPRGLPRFEPLAFLEC